MSNVIDNRVVEMRFDNEQFEKGVSQSLGTLDKLKQGLNFSGTDFASKLNFGTLQNAVGTVSEKFSAFEAIATGALMRVGAQAVEVGEKLVKSLSIEQISAGWGKYGEMTSNVATIMAATGDDIDTVSAQMEKLLYFTDETSYNFTDMANNIGKFTANGIGLDSATSAMEGIATWAAKSGQNAGTASRVMYNLAQAIGMGALKLQDWKSVELANMGTKEFKETAIQAGLAAGTLTKGIDGIARTTKGTKVEINNFRETLAEGWLDTKTLMETLNEYGKAAELISDIHDATGLYASDMMDLVERQKQGKLTTEELAVALGLSGDEISSNKDLIDSLANSIKQLASDEYEFSLAAYQAGQEARTFRDAIDATKDAVSSGWMTTFQLIFGQYDKAKVLWTDVANGLYDIFTHGTKARNELLKDWGTSKWDALKSKIAGTGVSLDQFRDGITKSLSRSMDIDAIIEKYGSLDDAIKQGAIDSKDLADAIRSSIGSIITGSNSLQSAEDKLKDIQDLVNKVWSGELGNGADRKSAITALGYDYDTIQKLVDKGKEYNIQIKDLTEEELKAIGLGEEEIKTLLAIQGDYETLMDLSGEGGQDMLAEGIVNSLTAISDLLTLVKDRWHEFFGSLSAGVLRDATESFRDFTESLKLYNEETGELTETGEKVKSVLDKVFSAAQNVGNIIKEGARIFGDFLKSLAPVRDAVGTLANSLYELFMSVTGRFGGFLQTIDLTQEFGSVSRLAAEGITFLAGKVDEVRVKFEAWKPGEGLQKLGERLQGIKEKLADFFKTTEDGVTPFQKIQNAVEGFLNKIKNVKTVLEPIKNFFKDFWSGLKSALDLDGVTNVFDGIVRILTNIFNAFKKLLSNFTLGDAIKAAGAYIGIQALKLGSIVPKLGGNLSNLLKTVSDFVGNFKENGLIGSLVGEHGIFGSLLGDGGILGKLFPQGGSTIVKTIQSVSTSLLMLGGALALIAVSLAILAAIKPENLGRALQTMAIALAEVGVLLLAFASAVELMKISPTTLIASGTAILIFAAALLVLAAALAAFSFVAKMEEVSTGLQLMAASVAIVSAALILLANAAKPGPLLASAAAIAVVSASLVALAVALAAFSAVAMMSSVWDGFILMAGSLAAVAVALALLANAADPVELIAAAAAIAIVSASLLVMAAALAAFTLIANQGALAAAGLLTLVAVLAALTVSLVVLSSLGPSILIGAAALVAASVAVIGIAAGLAAAAVAVATLGAAIAATILGLGIAVGGAVAAIAAGIGVALVAVSVGVTAAAAAMAASLGLLGAGFGTMIAQLFTGIGDAVAGFASGIGEAIAAIGKGFGDNFRAIGEGLGDGIKAITDAVAGIGDSIRAIGDGVEDFGIKVKTLSLIDLVGIGHGLVEFAKGVKEVNKNKFSADPAGVEAYANAFERLSQASSQIAPVAETLKTTMTTLGTEMTANLANGIQNGMASVGAAATAIVTNLNVSFRGAVTDATTSGLAVGAQFVSGITSGISAASAAGRSLAQAASSALSSYSYEFRSIGYNFSAGLASGISSGSGMVSSAARSVVSAAVSAARSAAQVRSPSRVFAKIGSYLSLGMAKGITDEAGSVEAAVEDLMRNTIDGVSLAMDAVADKLSQDIDDEIVITPVLDLSNVESNAKSLNGLLSNNNYTFSAAGSIAAQEAANQNAANMPQAVVASIDPAALAALSGSQRVGSPKVEVNFTGSLAQLGAVLQPVITAETDRLGSSLINA